MKHRAIIIFISIILLLTAGFFAIPLSWDFASAGENSINYDKQENGKQTEETLEFSMDNDCYAYRVVFDCKCKKGTMKYTVLSSDQSRDNKVATYETKKDGTHYVTEKMPSKNVKQFLLTIHSQYVVDGRNSFKITIQKRYTLFQKYKVWKKKRAEERNENKVALQR